MVLSIFEFKGLRSLQIYVQLVALVQAAFSGILMVVYSWDSIFPRIWKLMLEIVDGISKYGLDVQVLEGLTLDWV